MTTKTYPIIHLNNQVYMIDREAVIKAGYLGEGYPEGLGDYYYDGNHNRIVQVDCRQQASSANQKKDVYEDGTCKILASTDKSLGLPLLPPIEEDDEYEHWDTQKADRKAKMYAELNGHRKGSGFMIQKAFRDGMAEGFTQGYKAASSKKYTEKDIYNAIQYGVDSAREHLSVQQRTDKFISTLNPLPTHVEVEIVEHYFGMDSEGPIPLVPSIWLPKVDEKNFIKVKEWLWNE